MPHADSSLVPETIKSKPEFWDHVYTQLEPLLSSERNWVSKHTRVMYQQRFIDFEMQVTNLANASSVIYNSLLAFPSHFGAEERAINWCGAVKISSVNPTSLMALHHITGFYLDSSLFPSPHISTIKGGKTGRSESQKMLLGPFCGKPACQYIDISPGKARGVCADAFIQRQTALVPDVDSYPGHIACDGDTKSEIVCPLILKRDDPQREVPLGVLDLDCLALGGFDEEDRAGLERIAELVVRSCDW